MAIRFLEEPIQDNVPAVQDTPAVKKSRIRFIDPEPEPSPVSEEQQFERAYKGHAEQPVPSQFEMPQFETAEPSTTEVPISPESFGPSASARALQAFGKDVSEEEILEPSEIKEKEKPPIGHGKVLGPFVAPTKAAPRGIIRGIEAYQGAKAETLKKAVSNIDGKISLLERKLAGENITLPDDIYSDIQSGVQGTGKSEQQVTQDIISSLKGQSKTYEKQKESAEQWTRIAKDAAENSFVKKHEYERAETSVGRFAQDVATGLTQMVIAALTGPAAPATLAAQIGGGSIENMLEKDSSYEDAFKWSVYNAIAQMPFERIGFKKTFGPIKNAFTRELTERMATEGVTEFIQQYSDEISTIMATHKGTTEEKIKKIADDMWDITKNAIRSGGVGSVVGGLGGAARGSSALASERVASKIASKETGAPESAQTMSDIEGQQKATTPQPGGVVPAGATAAETPSPETVPLETVDTQDEGATVPKGDQADLTKIGYLSRENYRKVLGKIAKQKQKGKIKKLSLALADLINLGVLNDNFDHEGANNIVLELTRAFKDAVTQDVPAGAKLIFGRPGGDEFAVIGKNIDKNELQSLTDRGAEAVRKIVESKEYVNKKGERVRLSELSHPKHDYLKTGAGNFAVGVSSFDEVGSLREMVRLSDLRSNESSEVIIEDAAKKESVDRNTDFIYNKDTGRWVNEDSLIGRIIGEKLHSGEWVETDYNKLREAAKEEISRRGNYEREGQVPELRGSEESASESGGQGSILLGQAGAVLPNSGQDIETAAPAAAAEQPAAPVTTPTPESPAAPVVDHSAEVSPDQTTSLDQPDTPVAETQKETREQAVSAELGALIDGLNQEYEAQQAAESKSKQAGAVSFGKTQPTPAPQGEGVSEVSETLEAGREVEKNIFTKIKDAVARQVSAVQESFLKFNPHLKDVPQFREDHRTEYMPMRSRMINTIRKWKQVVSGPVYEKEGSKGLQKVADIVFCRDMISRGKDGLDLPNDLTVDQVQQHLNWLMENSSPEVIASADKMGKIMNALGSELIARGKLSETRENYAPHNVLDYRPDWMSGLRFPMQSKMKEPYRSYTKRAVGSKRLIATSDDALWTHVSKVLLDNAQEDWGLKQLAKYDATAEWKAQQKAAGQGTALKAGDRVKVNGKPYRAYVWKKTFHQVEAIDEGKLQQAIDENKTVQEWLNMKGPKGGKTVREAIAVGKPKIFLVPEPIAQTMNNITEKSPKIFDTIYGIGKITQLWKGFTLNVAGVGYHLGNIIGDTINTAVFDPVALKYLPTAEKVARKIFYGAGNLNEFEQKVLRVAEERDVARSGMISELRRATGLSNISKALESAAKVGEYRESLNRLAILAHQLSRADRGKKVQNVAGINVKGLDSESAAAKVAREALVDYVAVPRSYQLFLSRGATPFIRFHEGNFRNHIRAASGRGGIEVAMKYWSPVIATYAGAWGWNNLDDDRREKELQLPEYIRERLHFILGEDKEGNIIVWAPQQPVDMAASWLGLDSISRIISDVHAGKTSTEEAAKEIISEMGNGWRENSRSIMNPMIQAVDGLKTNEDPFTHRKVMPDNIFKLYKDDWTNKYARKYVLGFIAEKAITPIAQYTRMQTGTKKPVTGNPVMDWMLQNPLNVQRGVGIYKIDPNKGEIADSFDEQTQQKAMYDYWKDRFYNEVLRNGLSKETTEKVVSDAKDNGFDAADFQVSKWAVDKKIIIADLNYKLRNTSDTDKRRELLKLKNAIIKIRTMESKKSVPTSVRLETPE